ncbi:MAG: transcription antitermination factor NusB [bacterium]
MGRRREAREKALKELYRLELTGDAWVPVSETLIAPLAQTIVGAVMSRRDEIDAILAKTVEHWSIERLALIDKLVLRIGVAELLFLPETPPKVAIDEAVEIAKKFSTEKSGSFVNGVLDKIWKSHVPDKAAGGAG